MRQADLADQLGADKSTVSRQFAGSTPSEPWQARLADLFGCQPADLFRHPDGSWLAQFAAALSPDELDRAKAILSAAFPHATPRAGDRAPQGKTATAGPRH